MFTILARTGRVIWRGDDRARCVRLSQTPAFRGTPCRDTFGTNCPLNLEA